MRLQYTSRRGRYNLLNPREESVSCHIAVYDDEGNKIKSTNVSLEYEIDGTDVSEAIELITDYSERVLSSQYKEWEEMIAFLKGNQEAIEDGNRQYRIKTIKTKIEQLQTELTTLESLPPATGSL